MVTSGELSSSPDDGFRIKMNHLRYTFVAFFCCMLLASCGPSDDSITLQSPPSPEIVTFEGDIDKSIAGIWKSVDGKFTMSLHPDGTSHTQGAIGTPGGVKTIDNKGKWLVKDGALITQDEAGRTSKMYLTVPDKSTIETRRVKGSRIATVYKRQ